MRIFSSKKWIAAAVMILLALFLIRPGASRLKSRLIRSISAGVGRPVDIGAVHIRVLPRPGFDLDNLVVFDDPIFGAEPILRSSEVTADLRLTSLLRGRLEISRLDLTEPSLNLVHQVGGRWNLEALLERSAHIPLAPTAKAKSEPRPGFPYIEGSSGRINFKFGEEKKPYALTNADFALWQDSENAWGVRLKAQPFRGDFNLSDIGKLQVNGTWQRADSLRNTPLQFNLEWSGAQLGQVSKFVTGTDKGWRGTLQFDLALSGTPASLRITSDGSLDDFRRYDITSGKALRMAAHCVGEYSSIGHEFHQVMCNAPVGNGLLTFTGDMGLPGSHRFSIVMSAESIPASSVMILAERSKRNLPDDLAAQGTVQARLSTQEDAPAGKKLQFVGQGEIINLRLSSVADNVELGPQNVPFSFSASSASSRRIHSANAPGLTLPDGPHVEIGPTPGGSGHPGLPPVRGWINRNGYAFSASGEAEVSKTLRLARMVGLPVPPTVVDGSAQVDLQMLGTWANSNAGFAGPLITGTAKLHGMHIPVRGAGSAVAITAAEMQLSPDKVRVAKLNASAAGSTWTGWVEMPRGCGTPDACVALFSLNTNQLALGELHEWVSPNPATKAWYQVLNADPPKRPPLWASLRASGRVSADYIQVHGLVATQVKANLNLEKANLEISNLQANFLGGTYQGRFSTNFSVKPAACAGSGTLNGVSLANVATAMQDAWIAGSGNASFEVTGPCPSDFWQSAKGTLHLDMGDGVLPHIALADGGDPLQVRHLTAQMDLRGGKLEISDASLDAGDGKYELTGTISLKREMDLKLTHPPNGTAPTSYAITGTLHVPHVALLSGNEQARLKPLPSK